MEFILFIGIVVAVVWSLVFMKSTVADRLSSLSPLHLAALAVVFSGVVIGYDFFNIPSGPIPITIDRALFGGLVVLFVWHVLIARESLPIFNRLDLAVIITVSVLGLSIVTHDMTFRNNLPISRILFFHLIPVGVYFVARSSKLGVKEVRLIYGALGLLACYLAATAFAETRDWNWAVFPRYIMDPVHEEFLGRGRGPLLNPVSNGIFQVVGLGCIWCWWPKGSFRVRLAIVCMTLLLSVGVYSTLTRSVWMSLVLVGGLFIFLPSDQKTKGALIVGGTLALIALFPVLGEKVLSFKRDKTVSVAQMEQSAQLRPLFFIVAMNMFADRPVMGCGFAQYAREKYPYLQDPYSGKPVSATRGYEQHNVFLAYLTETGLVGVFSLVFFLSLNGRVCWLVWRRRELPLEVRQIGMVGGAMIICYVVNGLFHEVSITPMTNMLLYYVAGLSNNALTAQHGFVESQEDALLSRYQIQGQLKAATNCAGDVGLPENGNAPGASALGA